MAFFESIKYTVLKKDGPIELRQYDTLLLASTKTPKNDSQDSGFTDVYHYISGENEQEKKLSMTTPVVTYEEEYALITGFYISRKLTKDTVPRPTSSQVFINELEPSLYAVIRFRGKWNKENFDEHAKILLDYFKEHDLEVRSPRLIMRYNPPFIPGFLRHNEIAYQVDDKDFE